MYGWPSFTRVFCYILASIARLSPRVCVFVVAVERENIDKDDVFDASKEGGSNVKVLRDALVQMSRALLYFSKNYLPFLGSLCALSC